MLNIIKINLTMKLIFLFFVCLVGETIQNPFRNSKLLKSKSMTHRISGLNIQWPCATTRNIYMQTGRYIPRNIMATRVALWNNEAFLAIPRLKNGVPFTLGKISMGNGGCWSTVSAWPSWNAQEEGNNQALQSVVDLFLDYQEILWVLDVGVVNTLQQPVRRSIPKVVGIDVRTGQIIKTINLACIITSRSRLQYLVVDYDENGHGFIYIADAGSNAILVYDLAQSKGYRVILPSEINSPNANDVLYIALIKRSDHTSVLYFTYLGSSRLYSIKSIHLRHGKGSGAVVDVGPKPNNKQIVLLGTDNGKGLFLRFKGERDIFLWDTETCFRVGNLLEVQRGGDCRLPTQVVAGETLMWTLESDFHNYITDTVGCNGASVVLHPLVRECDG